MKELTKEERKAISQLEKLAEIWPSSLWLFSGSGQLCVMRKSDDGKKATTTYGGFDQDYLITMIDIDNDGGDW